MTQAEQKRAAKDFAKFWQDKGDEKQDTQTFYIHLLQKVFGVENYEDFINFELPIPKEFQKGKNFADGYIASTRVLIEQKSASIALDKPEKQSDDSLLTPYQQAKRYADNLNLDDKPRFILVSNFHTFEIHDMNDLRAAPVTFALKDLAENLHYLSFLADPRATKIKQETAISVGAGEIARELYDALALKYGELTEQAHKSLNMLCVRLVFCLYADDARLFGKRGMFHDFLASYRAENLREGLKKLFSVLDTPEKDRDPDDGEKFLAFPYVNGNLFSAEDNRIPQFDEKIQNLLLDKGGFDWKSISPTVFGAVFESTLNPATRHAGGMHYTSVENIHKLIDPLFLDEFRAEFASIRSSHKPKAAKREAYIALQNRLASIKILDPACGSGNFLTESFISLRRLENEILAALGQDGLFRDEHIKVSISQFYGVEINDFAVAVAKTALWIAESQMISEYSLIAREHIEFFPLRAYTNIAEGNAARIDWRDVAPADLSYIVGNPPFLGYSLQNKEQKEDILSVFGSNLKGTGTLDYVSIWYKKAVDLMKERPQIKAALVSTNSITQGEQPAILWKPLFEEGVHIDFAHRTFRWDSESADKAHVHCVIIGFSCGESVSQKRIFDAGETINARNINAYLLDAPNIFIESRKKSLCDIPEMQKGSIPVDDGNFFLTTDEKNELLKKEPQAEKFIRNFYGAREFLHNEERWCLWLLDASPKEILDMPQIYERVKKVRDFRLRSTKEATRKFADYPTRFMEIRQPKGNYILIPSHSSENRKYIPIGFVTPEIICGNANLLIPDATLYHFGVLTSSVHMAWTRAVCGRLKSDYRYSKDIVYNNFPWCEASEAQKAKIEKNAQAVLDARAKYPGCSLADLYDETLMPAELRKAHRDLDCAVSDAYGFARDASESEIVAELFARYEKLVSNLNV